MAHLPIPFALPPTYFQDYGISYKRSFIWFLLRHHKGGYIPWFKYISPFLAYVGPARVSIMASSSQCFRLFQQMRALFYSITSNKGFCLLQSINSSLAYPRFARATSMPWRNACGYKLAIRWKGFLQSLFPRLYLVARRFMVPMRPSHETFHLDIHNCILSSFQFIRQIIDLYHFMLSYRYFLLSPYCVLRFHWAGCFANFVVRDFCYCI